MSRRPTNRKCSLFFCDKKHYAHGYCRVHYLKNRNHGKAVWEMEHDKISLIDDVVELSKGAMYILANYAYGEPFENHNKTEKRIYCKECRTFIEVTNGFGIKVANLHEENCKIGELHRRACKIIDAGKQ